MSDDALKAPFDGPCGWIQFKGTDLCMDVRCECGELGHVDADFCYYVKCHSCGRVYEVNGHVKLHPVEGEPRMKPVVTT